MRAAIVLISTPKFSVTDLICCAQRELAMRHKVYPKQVALGQMTKAEADLEIQKMSAIVDYLQATEPKLF